MKLILFATCLWHTTLVHKGMPVRFTDLVKQPKIGQKIHINGTVWKVADTYATCSTPPQHKESK